MVRRRRMVDGLVYRRRLRVLGNSLGTNSAGTPSGSRSGGTPVSADGEISGWGAALDVGFRLVELLREYSHSFPAGQRSRFRQETR